jgi:hypothetical protein
LQQGIELFQVKISTKSRMNKLFTHTQANTQIRVSALGFQPSVDQEKAPFSDCFYPGFRFTHVGFSPRFFV